MIRPDPVLTVVVLAAALLGCRSVSNAPASNVPVSSTPVAALGIDTVVPSDELAAELDLGFNVRREGRLVERVLPGSAAATAGIEVGDVLVRLGGTIPFSQDDIEDFLDVRRPGEIVEVALRRPGGGGERTLEIVLGTGDAPPPGDLRWDFAGTEQLPMALARARELGKPLLVGLSGAET